jgi:hypothetical protein
MSNADIKRDLDESGMSLEEFFWLIVNYWRKHSEYHQSGVVETEVHQHRRLLDEWHSFHDLPDVYHEISHRVLEARQPRPVAKEAA